MIRFEQVTHQFPTGVTALDAVDLQIEPGEFIFVVGPSGAGKTTLLRLLLKELTPTQGKIFFQDEDLGEIKAGDIPKLRRRIGAIFQDFKLLEDRTLAENVALALQIQNRQEEKIHEAVLEALELVGLGGKEAMFPAQLSGGELQRGVIARAVVGDPDLVFADEPTGNLDPEISDQIVELLKQIQEAGKTVIMATHNVEAVDRAKERVVRLDKGKIVSDKKQGKYREKKKHE
jgi:cell division transport system ATP-binding protein